MSYAAVNQMLGKQSRLIDDLVEALRELHIIAADAQLRATYQRTALEQIAAKARAAIDKAEGRT